MFLLGQVPDLSQYLFVGDTAYSLGREVPVCERDVKWAAGSRDGKHAILILEEDGRPTLHLWSLASRTCKKVWQGSNEELGSVAWCEGRAFVTTGSVNEPNIVIQITTNGTAKVVAENSWPNVSADGSVALVTLNKQRLFQVVHADGSLSRVLAIPDERYLEIEGETVFASRDSGERLRLDFSTFEWTPAPNRTRGPDAKRPPPPWLTERSIELPVAGKTELVMYTYLQGEGIDRLIVSYGAHKPRMVGEKEGIMLQRGGSLTLIPILKEPAAAVRARIAEAEKAKALEGAKIMFLHFEAYAREHGGNMPDRDANLVSAFHESSHENEVLEEFVYEFAGGIPKDPARTVLGYIRTGTGRADLYANGHVVWVPGR